jgi:AAA15 family ATPase/GTPase
MPQFIVNDGDAKFMVSFWKHLFQKVGTKLMFSTAFDPQIDGQIKIVNGVLNQFFRNYVNINKKYWGEHLSLTKFYYNFTMHSAMKMFPFELMLGKEEKKTMDLTISMGCKDHSKEVVEMVKGREEKYARAKKLLEHAPKGYEKHAKKTQKHVEFGVGQHVSLNIQDLKMLDGHAPRFIAKYVGLYEILHYCIPTCTP